MPNHAPEGVRGLGICGPGMLMHLFLAGCVCCAGCGRGSGPAPPETYPVTGTVLGEDGRPLSGGAIYFRSTRESSIEALAEVGADVIVGHGPHVLQRVEWVGETLVAYSLGNFLFDQLYPADCRWGAILRVTLRGERIVAVAAAPTVVERGRVRPASPEVAAAILDRLNLES